VHPGTAAAESIIYPDRPVALDRQPIAPRHVAGPGLRRALPLPLLRAAYRAAHAGLRVWWLVRRPRTFGVKCVVVDGDRVLFVRHTYGDRAAWELPGGNPHRGEEPAEAARREAREELGLEPAAWRELARLEVEGDGKRTLLFCFAAAAGDGRLRLDPGEIAEARWARPADPPQPVSPDAEAILALLAPAA
jgi:ADP-ribose pyrophosphatase YjhB (NUDIX family)